MAFKVGVQLHPQQTTMKELREAWRAVDQLGVDSIFTWDHFFPLYGDPEGPHFEAMSLLAAVAVETSHAMIGALVTANTYRNPNLLADIARTIDHLSEGRFIIGIGAGWFERDYKEYGYEFGTAVSRLRMLDQNLPIVKERLRRLNPPPIGKVPILVGGGGERVTLRIAARDADMWNTFGPAATYARKCKVLDEWCRKLGRDPASIERTVSIRGNDIDDWETYLRAGAQHIILEVSHPFDLKGVRRLLQAARA